MQTKIQNFESWDKLKWWSGLAKIDESIVIIKLSNE